MINLNRKKRKRENENTNKQTKTRTKTIYMNILCMRNERKLLFRKNYDKKTKKQKTLTRKKRFKVFFFNIE